MMDPLTIATLPPPILPRAGRARLLSAARAEHLETWLALAACLRSNEADQLHRRLVQQADRIHTMENEMTRRSTGDHTP